MKNRFIILPDPSRVKAGLILVLWGLTLPLAALDTEVVDSLLDQQVVLSAPKELHITNTGNAMVNSTVSLNHEDAWLFFDNLPPSEVAADYLGYVKVNGNAFNSGNGRMAIYAHGTVLMPHGSGFKPMTVYKEEDFSGDSLALGIQVYYNDLDTFERAVKSFRLKRGYMATFATSPDGTGYSRVFIADQEDLEWEVMPAELYGTVSFIRVFKHEWVTRKGWAGGQWEAGLTSCTWNYDWSSGGSTTQNIEYVPQKWSPSWPGWGLNNKENISHVLGFNEPDRPDQSNISMETALSLWPQFMNSGLRIGSPATSDAFNSWSLFQFIDRCDELNYRVDYVAVHAYWVKSPQQWYNDLKYIHERTGRPIWITEWNNGANWTGEWWPSDSLQALQKQLNDIKGILQVLDTARFVERYSIYNWVEDKRAMVLGSSLTPAGEYYKANHSRIAFDRVNEVIPPGWNYAAPQLSYRYLSLSDKISLSWSDSNGGLSRGYKLEKKVNDEAYRTLFETDDPSLKNYTDDLDSAASGRISYRVSLATVYGNYVSSGEVSYYQSHGDTVLQTGIFPIANRDWTLCLFSEEFQRKPLLITGIPTFNNITALTHRINNVSESSFRFRLDAWEYLNEPVLTRSEDLAMMALVAGEYDFGGLQGLAGQVSGVAGEWVPVAFDPPFDSPPAVFCTQASNNTFFPTMPAMRNVTEGGFELSLRCEEAIPATSIIDETVHFLAVETGRGAMGDYRITVGRTGEGGTGISGDPVVLAYDSSYTSPALYASLLSSADAFASTLRYYTTGEHEYTLLKQRELSGKIQVIKEDELGWLVMDLSPGQPVFLEESEAPMKPNIYPNPAADYIHLDLRKLSVVGIYDFSGRKILEKKALHVLDVHHLPAGIYFLKAEGRPPVKFIKK